MPACPGPQSSEALAGWEQFKKSVSRVSGVPHNVFCSPLSPRAVKVLDGGQGDTNDALSSPHSALQFRSVLSVGSSKPHSDGGAQNGLDDCSVELQQQLRGQSMSPQEAQEVHPLLGLLEDGADVLLPLQILRDDRAQESEALHSGHRAAEDCEGGTGQGDVS